MHEKTTVHLPIRSQMPLSVGLGTSGAKKGKVALPIVTQYRSVPPIVSSVNQYFKFFNIFFLCTLLSGAVSGSPEISEKISGAASVLM